MNDKAAEIRTLQRDLIVRYIFIHLVFSDPSVDQSRVEVCLKERQGLHIIFLQNLRILFLANLLVQFDFQRRKYICQFHGIDRF